MKKILFPTDFSETAENAFIYASHFAKSLNAELLVFHSFERPVMTSLKGENMNLIEDVYENIELGEMESFKQEAQKLREIAKEYGLEDVSLNFIFENGELIYNIKNIVQRENIYLIIMGTSGHTGFATKFWGSNTVKAIQSIKAPILSIPHYAKFKPIKTCGLTTVFKETDQRILKDLLRLANFFDGEVKILHVIEYSGNVDKKEQFSKDSIEQWTNYFNHNPRLHFIVVKSEDAKKEVVKFINTENIDLLIIVKRNLSFIDSLFYSSLTKSIASKIDIPLLVIREPEEIKNSI